MTKPGINHDEIKGYSPVANWNPIRLVLELVYLMGWSTNHIDYIIAFLQATVQRVAYMRIPKGSDRVTENEGKNIVQRNPNEYFIQVHINVYESKVAGRVWNDYLTKKLIQEVRFYQSKIDEYVLFKGKRLFLLYTDDSILSVLDQNEINDTIKYINKANIDITVIGDNQNFLGINIEKNRDGNITSSQPHLIDKILKGLRLDKEKTVTNKIPALRSRLLTRHTKSEKLIGFLTIDQSLGS